MTKEEVKEFLPFIKAFAEGKTIQVMCSKSSSEITWQDVDNPNFMKGHLYRVKPEAEYRPFNSKNECWNEMLKHEPFGWVTDGDSNYNIRTVNNSLVNLGDYYDYIPAFRDLKFIDGEPFGIKEDE